MNNGCRDDGLADTFGAIILVSVVVLGVAIAGVAVLSTPVSQKVPALDVDITNTTTTVFLTHSGGDSLLGGTYRILVDGQDKTNSFTKAGAPLSGWSTGETLVYIPPGGRMPSSYQIVYTGGKGPQVILTVMQ